MSSCQCQHSHQPQMVCPDPTHARLLSRVHVCLAHQWCHCIRAVMCRVPKIFQVTDSSCWNLSELKHLFKKICILTLQDCRELSLQNIKSQRHAGLGSDIVGNSAIQRAGSYRWTLAGGDQTMPDCPELSAEDIVKQPVHPQVP